MSEFHHLFYVERFGYCLGGGSFKTVFNQGQLESKSLVGFKFSYMA